MAQPVGLSASRRERLIEPSTVAPGVIVDVQALRLADLAIHRQRLFGTTLPGVAGRPQPSCCDVIVAPHRVVGHPKHRVEVRSRGLVRIDRRVTSEFRQARDRGTDDWTAERHRLDQWEAETLIHGREDEGERSPIEMDQDLVVLPGHAVKSRPTPQGGRTRSSTR